MRIQPPIARFAQVAPERRALVDRSRRLTFADFDRLIVRAAAHLRSVGGERGARVAIMARNSLAWVVTAHACSRSGAILVPIHARSSPVEIRRLMTILAPTILLTDEDFSDVAAHDSVSRQMMLADAARAWEGVTDADAGDIPDTIELDAINAVVATSGSTGEAKYVCLTNRNWYFSALASAMHLGHRADDCWLLNLPLCHVGGMSILQRAAVSGFSVIVQEGFDAAQTLHAIDEERVTHLSLVPTTLSRLLDAAGSTRFPEHVRAVLVGGGPCPTELLNRARAAGLPVLPTYGLTEAASQVATLPPHASLDESGVAGRALPFVDIDIRDDDGHAQPSCMSGAIWIRGPMVAREYWMTAGPAPALDDAGWFATNDLGYVDDAGLLHVLGRSDDVIISGGENVSLREIESVLATCAGVERAAVIAVADDDWGQAPVAFVVPTPTQLLDVAQLESALRQQLAAHKLPKRIVLLDQLPETSIGKVDRRALARLLVDKE